MVLVYPDKHKKVVLFDADIRLLVLSAVVGLVYYIILL